MPATDRLGSSTSARIEGAVEREGPWWRVGWRSPRGNARRQSDGWIIASAPPPACLVS